MIWLLRHAEAAAGHPDERRALTERGIAQARAAGLALKRLGVSPQACLSSPKLRALQTAQLACEPLGLQVKVEPALAGEPFEAAELSAGLRSVLLVGHDPSFSMAVHELTGARARMRKGGLAGIDDGELVVLMRPRELFAIAAAAERESAR
jgi:phosphohistidine phosphatase